MKCKVRLTRTVEMIVEGRDEEEIMDWLRETTPEEAFELSMCKAKDFYDEDILNDVPNHIIADYVIGEV